MKVPSEVMIQLVKPGRWLLYNVYSRTCVAADLNVLELMGDVGGLSFQDLEVKYASRFFRFWEIGTFSNIKGLMADPSRFIRNPEEWPDPLDLDFLKALAKLKESFLSIENEKEYRQRFSPKTSLVDGENFGNFHQQLGQELLLNHREYPEDWWLKQKFYDDCQNVRENLYAMVQAPYLKKYFRRRLKPGHHVVDLGCGIGLYSKWMAETGATVIGLDPNKKYIELAKRNKESGLSFEVMDVGVKGALDKIPSGSADFVFMSDALLFYFVSERPQQKADVQVLLADIRRILKPNGTFISMEPHHIFWLLPWFGEQKHPFTILTEYHQKQFGVTPTMAQLVQTYAQGGFSLVWMDEVRPEPSKKSVDLRAYHFAKEFPLWQLFELKPL